MSIGYIMRVGVLPAVVRACSAVGMETAPKLVSAGFGYLAQMVKSDYQIGASLKYANLPYSAIKEDHARLMGQLEEAASLKETPNIKSSDREYLEVSDVAGVTIARVQRWKAHTLGIRHKTSNVILLLDDGRVLLQQRSKGKDLFPNKWTISAGGHISDKDGKAPTADTRKALQRELFEELGLNVEDLSRFEVWQEEGTPNFIKVWEYERPILEYFGQLNELGSKVIFIQFDRNADCVGVEVKKGELSDAKRESLISAIRSAERSGKSLEDISRFRLKTWNEELCYYYVLKIRANELKVIEDELKRRKSDPNSNKSVADMKLVTLDEMVRAGQNLDTATDSLHSLCYRDPMPFVQFMDDVLAR